MIKIFIIIATFNRKLFLKKILEQINNQILSKEIEITTIVVNDGSTDGSYGMLKCDFPKVIVINGNGNWWWTMCMNEGIKKAKVLNANFILILNDDTEIKADYIETIWLDYKKLPLNSILGSASISINPNNLIDFAGSKELIRWRMKPVHYLPNLTPIFDDFKGIYPTWTLNGRGTLIPISVLNLIGLFDEKLVQYGSDYEYIYRAKKEGIEVFISWNSRVYNHLLMTSEGTSFRNDSIWKFIRSFFNPYSVNSIKKTLYIYYKYSYKYFIPFFLIYSILGTIRSFFFKYRKFK